jgi:sialate O-acetylesterase
MEEKKCQENIGIFYDSIIALVWYTNSMENTFTINKLFQNGMVLQQQTKNCVSGTAATGSAISVTFRKKRYVSKADASGRWKVVFNPGEAGGPDVLTVTSSDEGEVTFTNVYTGEVWLCSGQSNMQLPMERLKYTYPQEMNAPVNELLRLYTVPISYSFAGEKNDLPEGGMWQPVGPNSISSFSGTSYFFAKKLQHDLKVPVGIINASQGGSPIASWLSEGSIKKWPLYVKRLEECRQNGYVETEGKKAREANDAWFAKCNSIDVGLSMKWNELEYEKVLDWNDFSVPGVDDSFTEGGTVWYKKEFMLLTNDVYLCSQHKVNLWLGTIIDSDTVWVNGTQCGSTPYQYPPRRYEIPQNVLHEGSNTITIRVVHCGKIVSFTAEKPYFIFTDNVKVKPTRPGNIICAKGETSIDEDSVCVDLKGVWKMKEGCSLEEKPSDLFFEWQPTALYNSMLAPCFTYAVRGFVWYQGESDTGNPQNYEAQLTEMISLWRKKFSYRAEKNAPFIITQLPNCGERNDILSYSGWAAIRDAEQKAAYRNKNCGLAVTIDAGEWNDLHPENKETVGTRCAYEALRLAYKQKVPVSPRVKKVSQTDDGVMIEMSGDVMCKGNEMPVIACVLCGAAGSQSLTRMTVQAVAHTKIIAALPPDEMGRGSKITEVMYAWCDSPVKTVLYDKTSTLPVGPFRIKV